MFMLSWHADDRIALGFRTTLGTIDCAYFQLPGGNSRWADIKHRKGKNDELSIL
jgi:hypothetical protein